MLDWHGLVRERSEWAAHNFPDQEHVDLVFGVFEECGELAHAHLKRKQGIRGTAEELDEKARDAIGDATVFSLGLMERGVPDGVDEPITVVNLDQCMRTICYRAGQLSLVTTGAHISGLLRSLRAYCRLCRWDYDQVVKETWESVQKRDWVENPDTGRLAAAHDLEDHEELGQ